MLSPTIDTANLLANSSFESIPTNFVDNYNNGNIVNYYDTNAASGNSTNRLTGWQTTASDEKIEIWNSDNTVLPSVDAFLGDNYAEINATQEAELHQEVNITIGDAVDYVFYHRARNLAAEQLRFRITDLGLRESSTATTH